MDEMVKQHIVFLTPEALKDAYLNDRITDYTNIGIQLDQKMILSQVMYSRKIVKKVPYALFVNPSSYDAPRSSLMNYLLEDMIIKKHQEGKTFRTITAGIHKIVKFVNWIDTEAKFPATITEARSVYQRYTRHLKSEIRLGNLSQGEAHVCHSSARNMLRAVFQDAKGEITYAIANIPNKRDGGRAKSSDDDIAHSFRFYTQLFDQISDFLLQGKEYPFLLNLPAEDLWVIPSSTWIKPQHSNNDLQAFDYKTGRVRDEDEIKNIYNLRFLRDGRWARRALLEALNKNNTDLKSDRRMKLGVIAAKAYFMHFLAITGMNDSTAGLLLWSDEFQIEKTKQKYRNIKLRAGNKPVEFQIQSKFIDRFRKYLELRNYLLNTNKCEYLFFEGYSKKAKLGSRQTSGSRSSVINAYMKKTFDKTLPIINSKQSRVNKTHQVIKKSGIEVAAKLAQSSRATILKHYHGESDKTSGYQISEFFDHLNSNLLNEEKSSIETNIGRCSNHDHPGEYQDEVSSIHPDCKQPEGCLFCDKHRIHPDESDIRKLFSLQYVINQSRYVAKSEEHFNATFWPSLNRIYSIVSVIENLSDSKKALVLEVKEDVMVNENLTEYWEKKLTFLIDAGVLK